MFDSNNLRNPAWLISGLVLAAIAVFGSPFLIDYLNSGDQLPPTLQIVDPQLFQNDSIVQAMGRLKSGFYLALAAAMKLLRISPQQIELIVYGLFIASKLLLIAAVFAVCWSLKKSFWLFAVFAAWCCHQKPALLGSVTLFMPLVTHNEVALVMGLFAIACLLRDRMILFWLLAGLMVLVHVIVGLQFVLCFAPAWMLNSTGSVSDLSDRSSNIANGSGRSRSPYRTVLLRRLYDKNFLIGAGMFALCCVVYMITMTPPAMSAEEWQLFVSTNGNTGHISLFRHSWLDLFGFAAFFGLTLAAYNRYLKDNAGFELLRRAAICGSVIGPVLSLAAILSRAMKPMLFQPMRVFFWVTLICFLLIVAAMVEAFKQSRLAGILLASVLVLTVLNSILAPLFAFIGLVYFLADWLTKRFGESVQKLVQTAALTVLTIGVAGIFAAWALGSRQPVGSLRSPVLLLPCAICLAVLFLPNIKNWQMPLAAAMIVYCLAAASIYRHNYAERWLDADWRAVRQWCQANTRADDRFITPPDQIGFRVLALRSTASESLPRVIWSAPFAYLENKQSAERAGKGYANNSTDPAYLFDLAREWNCSYVIARGNYDAKFTPLFRAGKFSVLKTPDR